MVYLAMGTPILEFSNVTVIFDDVVALENVSFRVDEGDSAVIFGVAGSGKSVLLKLALGLVCPDAGQIYLFGEQINAVRESDLLAFRRQAGMLFQEGALFDSQTVRENVAWPLLNQGQPPPAGEVEARVREALGFVELEQAIDKLPSELSGGMRRRVGIARAIVNRPRLVLYDSPTAGLDPITAHTIMTLILKERDTAEVTSLLVTHRLQNGHLLANFRYDPSTGELTSAARNGSAPPTRTQFLVLNKGKLAFAGSQEELRRQQDPYVRKFVLASE
jgi:phospholipid/cholesterol/gamma-HCH transport system ATP-binding protein